MTSVSPSVVRILFRVLYAPSTFPSWTITVLAMNFRCLAMALPSNLHSSGPTGCGCSTRTPGRSGAEAEATESPRREEAAPKNAVGCGNRAYDLSLERFVSGRRRRTVWHSQRNSVLALLWSRGPRVCEKVSPIRSSNPAKPLLDLSGFVSCMGNGMRPQNVFCFKRTDLLTRWRTDSHPSSA